MNYLQHAIELSKKSKGGPFGACLVKAGVLVEGQNEVVATHDPTAHAEIVAIRAACKAIGSHDLSEWTLYSSCEPCPMCKAAIEWAGIRTVVYAASRHRAAAAGFRDLQIELEPATRYYIGTYETVKMAVDVLQAWKGINY